MLNQHLLRILTTMLVAVLVASCGAATPAAQQQPPTSVAPAATKVPELQPTQPPAGPPRGGMLRIGYGAEVDNLNAFTSQFLTDIELTMVEGLIVSNDKNQYIPVLAKQVPTVANGLVKTRAD